MPDLLLELFSEEIPARMQVRAAEDLRKLVTDALVGQGLVYEAARAYATPRRLTLSVTGLPARSPDTREERKGPRVGAPEAALAGFLKAAGLSSIDEAAIQSDPKKGDFYVAVTARPGRDARDVIAGIVPDVIRRFPWPKSMRWGSGSLRWVRPLQSILCVFGPETEETEVVDFDVDGLKSGRTTFGHRFMAPGPIAVRRFDDYVEKLERAFVVLDPERRREIVRADARTLAFAQGFDLVEDDALVDEVSGLVEWPVVLMGSFDPAFLEIPPEVIRLTIRANQKCFVVREAGATSPLAGEVDAERRVGGEPPQPAVGTPPPPIPPRKGEGRQSLAPRFLLVSNLIAEDGGERIVAGNGRVIAARLSDARFFYETDLKTRLEVHAEKLRQIVFHEKLGTQGERVERIAHLAHELAPFVGADPDKAERAARLAKADLVTEMVGEFPELQGVMGRYYALAQGEDAEVADAIRDHYKPAGAGDAVPTAPVSIAVALADRLDTLVGFWAIDEKPTGSKDPYALRRAALGVIRIVLGNGVRISLSGFFQILRKALTLQGSAVRDPEADELDLTFNARDIEEGVRHGYWNLFNLSDEFWSNRLSDLLAFFADRLKVQLREEGARHDLVDAVFALGAAPAPTSPLRGGRPEGPGGGEPPQSAVLAPPPPAPPRKGEGSGALPGEGAQAAAGAVQDDLLMIVRRVEALAAFLDTEDGASLLTAYRRAANILAIEERKDGRTYGGHADPAAFAQHEERILFDRIAEVAAESDSALQREDFAAAMAALARLRAPVDSFFDTVTVNADDPALRKNRLRLLSQIRAAMDRIADFSRIAG